MEIASWWKLVETAPESAPGPSAPEWLVSLSQAQGHQFAFRLKEAREQLEAARGSVPAGPWRNAFDLVECSIAARQADAAVLEGMVPKVRALIRALPPAEQATRARAWHLLAVIHIRRSHLTDAEEAIFEALKLVEEAPSRTWIVDGCGQVLLGLGAWVEGRRTMKAVARRREADGDPVGLAITAGHQARLELELGRPKAAEQAAREGLSRQGPSLSAGSRLRLQTMLLQACVEQGNQAQARIEAGAVEELLGKDNLEQHYLGGYACLALARLEALAGAPAKVRQWIDRAGRAFTLPDQTALLRYWEAKLLPGEIDSARWLETMKGLFSKTQVVCEAELLTWLHLAEARGSEMRSYLDLATERAVQSNNPLWLERVDRTYRALDPERLSACLVRRYSGRSLEEMQTTVKEESTIIFADLVNFTPRSQKLEPEAVMETVRSLFELSVTLLRTHHVRPISYLGDGLLAVCQGPDHPARGLGFARELVKRAARVTLLRRALGEEWGLDVRAGVASGPVVFGILGNLFKMEYAAIGMTTNLAARLQGQANPGEVVCQYETAAPQAAEGKEENLALKGIEKPIRAVRFPAWS